MNTDSDNRDPDRIDVPFRARVSASAINTFERCPRQYVLRYLDRKQARSRTSIPLAIGNAVHHALQKFFGLPHEHRSLDDLHNCLRSVWHYYRTDAGFASREEEAASGFEALSLLTRFYETNDISAVPIAREEWVESTPLGTEISVYGKVDRVDAPDGAGGLSVIDYKTGTREIGSVDLHEDRAAQIYLIAVAEDFGEPVEAVKYLYLASGNEAAWHPEEDDVEAARDSLELVTAEMLHVRSLDATPGGHCRFCDFRRTCPAANATDPADLEVPEGIDF